MKKIWILGVGQFGQEVANTLLENKKSTILVDKNEDKLTPYKNFNVAIHIMDTENIEALAELEIDEKDSVFVSMGENIRSSILTVQNLIDLEVAEIYVRTIDERHEKIIKSMGIKNTIRPYQAAAKELIYRLINKVKTVTFSDNQHIIINVRNTKIKQKKIKQINIMKDIHLILIRRKNETKSFIPNGETEIILGDSLTILIKIEKEAATLKLFQN